MLGMRQGMDPAGMHGMPPPHMPPTATTCLQGRASQRLAAAAAHRPLAAHPARAPARQVAPAKPGRPAASGCHADPERRQKRHGPLQKVPHHPVSHQHFKVAVALEALLALGGRQLEADLQGALVDERAGVEQAECYRDASGRGEGLRGEADGCGHGWGGAVGDAVATTYPIQEPDGLAYRGLAQSKTIRGLPSSFSAPGRACHAPRRCCGVQNYTLLAAHVAARRLRSCQATIESAAHARAPLPRSAARSDSSKQK